MVLSAAQRGADPDPLLYVQLMGLCFEGGGD
jgi:hypothetical protein